jgi:hypothetical protein
MANVITNGAKAVTAAGTRVALSTDTGYKTKVVIRADAANDTDTVYVGDSTVASANGYPLLKNEVISLENIQLSNIYLDASAAAGVRFIAYA